MRQTLFRIPLDGPWSFGPLGEVPGFGMGIVLAAWMVFGAIWLYRRRSALSVETAWPSLLGWAVIAAAIYFLPQMVHGQANATIAEANRVLSLNPQSVDAYLARARAHYQKREFAAAIADLESAAKLEPGRGETFDRLAWIQAASPHAPTRDAAAALANARKAVALGGQTATFLSTLAAAQAENGDYATAAETMRSALKLGWKGSETRVLADVPRMREQLQAHERGRPYRDQTAGKSLPIFGFGAMLFVAFLAAAWSAGRRGEQVGISSASLWDMGIWVFIAGVVGCRIFYCIQYAGQMFYKLEGGEKVLKSLPELVFAAVNLPDGGLVYYGGVITGALAVIWIARKQHIDLLLLGDVIMPSLFLAMAIGRIGCFLNGCCYGDRCELPWGVLFPMGSVPDTALLQRGFIAAHEDLAIRLHPTQLYSTIDGLLLALLAYAYFPYRPRNGAVVALVAIVYPLTRIAIEFLRGDELGQFNTRFTISQWASVVLLAIGVIYTIWLSTRPKLAAA